VPDAGAAGFVEDDVAALAATPGGIVAAGSIYASQGVGRILAQ
jgi:hypothetical protein